MTNIKNKLFWSTSKSNFAVDVYTWVSIIVVSCDQWDYQASQQDSLQTHIQSQHEGIKLQKRVVSGNILSLNMKESSILVISVKSLLGRPNGEFVPPEVVLRLPVVRVDDSSLRQADFAPGGGKQWRLYLQEILGDCLNKGILKLFSGRNFPKVEITKVVRYGNIQREERPGNCSEDDRQQDNSFSDSSIHLDTTMEMGVLS